MSFIGYNNKPLVVVVMANISLIVMYCNYNWTVCMEYIWPNGVIVSSTNQESIPLSHKP